MLKISVTDFSASLAIDISFVRNSRTPNVTQICVSSEEMNEWFDRGVSAAMMSSGSAREPVE